jgi:hypothetical protein
MVTARLRCYWHGRCGLQLDEALLPAFLGTKRLHGQEGGPSLTNGSRTDCGRLHLMAGQTGAPS